jgi:hypothetical protein
MVGSGDVVFADAGLNLSEEMGVVVVFRYLHVLLGTLDNFLGEVVGQTAEKVVGGYEPTPRLSHCRKLLHHSLDYQLFVLVEFQAIPEVDQGAEFLVGLDAGFAGCSCQKFEVGLDLLVDSLFVFLLITEYQLMHVLKMLHVIQEGLKVCNSVLLEGHQRFDVALLEALFGHRD